MAENPEEPSITVAEIEKVMSRAERRQALRILVGSVILVAILLLLDVISVVSIPVSFYALPIGYSLIQLTRWVVIEYRIKMGWYGQNAYEAREIVSFIIINSTPRTASAPENDPPAESV